MASTTSTACFSCCTAPGRRHHVPAADHRPVPRQRRRSAARGRRSGQHHVDGVRMLLPAPGRRHQLLQLIIGRILASARRRAALEHRGGQHHVDGVLQLLHGAWPAPPRSCS
ncbi:hypothetical protein ACWYXJ_29165 [Janthinobacterium lividum]